MTLMTYFTFYAFAFLHVQHLMKVLGMNETVESTYTGSAMKLRATQVYAC